MKKLILLLILSFPVFGKAQGGCSGGGSTTVMKNYSCNSYFSMAKDSTETDSLSTTQISLAEEPELTVEVVHPNRSSEELTIQLGFSDSYTVQLMDANNRGSS